MTSADTLLDLMRQARDRIPHVKNDMWRVSPKARNILALRFLRVRKAWPAKPRYRKPVHRAYRKLGVFP